MRTIFDLETRSGTPIKDGPHKYAMDKDFGILIFVWYSEKYNKVMWTDDGDEIDRVILEVTSDENNTMIAHNLMGFDRIMLEREADIMGVGHQVFKNKWSDTLERARITQEPKVSLDSLATKYGTYKEEDGKDLIKLFSMPHKVTKAEAEEIGDMTLAGKTMFITKEMMPQKWAEFVEYAVQDVEAEVVIDKALPELSEFEAKVSEVTYQINKHGSRINLGLTHALLEQREANNMKAKASTSINTGSTKQMKEEAVRLGFELENTQAKYLQELLEYPGVPKELKELIEIRLSTNLAALKKLDVEVKMEIDGFVHDYFVYAGASSTGRFAGRGLQLQNLAHDAPDEKKGESYRMFAEQLEAKTITNNDMAKLVRPTLIADEGDLLVILDFKNIEARVQAWIAGDEHLQHAFREGLDVYKMTATKMWDVKYEDVTPAQRKDAKTATLALGYGGGVNSLEAFGYKGEDPQGIVNVWRSANQPITKAWKRLMAYVDISYMKTRERIELPLPSGRKITFHGEELRRNERGQVEMYIDAGSKSFWKSLYGGMLFNRVVQGFARDVMAEAMVRVSEAGYMITNSVHDEVVVTVPKETAHEDFEKIKDLMLDHGYDGLLLDIDGEVSPFYRK